MKFILKRRKHRKGIKPKRKGSLKVRIITLPTQEEHSDRVDELFDIVGQAMRDPKFKAYIGMTYGELWASKRHGAMMDAILHKIGLMQQGYDFFREFKQMQFTDLAEPAILEFDALNSKIETPCDTCGLKNRGGCPFEKWEHVTNKAEACFMLRDAEKPQVKTTSEMASLAITHLS
jgi:hypothetical protein